MLILNVYLKNLDDTIYNTLTLTITNTTVLTFFNGKWLPIFSI